MADPAAGPTRYAARPSVAASPALVFALSFALLLSDFMCRQVLAAVFRSLRSEWALTTRNSGG